MGFIGFLFCWFLVGAITAGFTMWLFRAERDVPTKIIFWCIVLGVISPFIAVIGGIAYMLDNKEEFKNPFYKEPKKEENNE